MIISERNVLSYCFEQFLDDGTIDPITWFEKFAAPDVRDELRIALLEIVNDEHPLGAVDVGAIEPPRGSAFRSVLFRTKDDDGNTRSIATFCFKDAGKQSLFAVLGIAVALIAHAPGLAAAGKLATIARALWKNLSLLRRPENDAEIDALEALIKIQTLHFEEGTNILPSTRTIAELLRLDPLAVLPSILSLEKKNIVRSVIPVPGDPNPQPSEMRWQLRF